MISINYLIKVIFNKYLKKTFTINTEELQITVNFINFKMLIINYEALKKECTINIAELQTAAILTDYFKIIKYKLSTTIYIQSSLIKSSSELKIVFYKDEEESFVEIKDIEII